MLKKQSATNQAAEYIKKDILSGKYKVGEKYLSENELCRILTVSRTTVREAVRVVTAMGLLEIRSGCGAFVSSTDERDLSVTDFASWNYSKEEMEEVLFALEPLAAELAAKYASEEDIINALGTQALLERAFFEERDISGYDIIFHNALYAASHNTLLFDLISGIYKKMGSLPHNERVLSEHKAILDAMVMHNPEEAKAAMEKHIRCKKTIRNGEKYMTELWNKNTPFPEFEKIGKINGIKHINIHTVEEEGYHFLLGSAIVRFGDTFFASWAHSWREENDSKSILAEKRSEDGGKTWSEIIPIAAVSDGFARSHGVYCNHNGKLYAFCPRAKFDVITEYPELKMEGYVLGDDGRFECIGIVLDDGFWPMTEPFALDNGNLLMPGLYVDGGYNDKSKAAVAICDGVDLSKWEMVTIPNPDGYNYWGETAVIKRPDHLLAISRASGSLNALVSTSYDEGKTWSALSESNLPISQSKMCAGTLSNGISYLVFNMADRGYRDTLAIAIGRDTFEKIYIIRDGFDEKPKYQPSNEWSYPYAFEDTSAGILYITYNHNKENNVVSAIPLESLTLGDK